jgi:hypothetical protein
MVRPVAMYFLDPFLASYSDREFESKSDNFSFVCEKKRPAGSIRTNYSYEIDYTPKAYPLDRKVVEKNRKRRVNVP